MPIFLAKQTLKEAIERLGESSAQSSLGDFLIFKRALQIRRAESGDHVEGITSVVTGLTSGHFVQAIRDLALRLPRTGGSIDETENPYFVPFGAARAPDRGYRTKKFPSNGPSDTVSRWQSRSKPPLVLVPDTRPKAYAFTPRSQQDLVNFFIKGASIGAPVLPRLLDAAIWRFRFTDLADRFGGQPTAEQLERGFVADIGLTDVEQKALFSNELGEPFDDAGVTAHTEVTQ